jgi:tetratricopeptide (TPR) repeat protein
VEHLAKAGDLAAARDRHAGWAIGFAEAAAANFATMSGPAWVNRVQRMFPELRAAHGWLVGRDIGGALRLVAALRPYALWCRNIEVSRWAEVTSSAVATGPESASRQLRLATLLCAFTGAWQRGDQDAGDAFARMAADVARGGLEDRFSADIAADVAYLAGDVEGAAALHRLAATQAVAAGDLLQAAWALGSVAIALAYGSKLDDARAALQEVDAIAASCESQTARSVQEWAAGGIEAAVPDLVAAQSHFQQALAIAHSAGNRQVEVEVEFALAMVKARQGDVNGALDHCEKLLADNHATTTSMLPRDLVRVIELLTLVESFHDGARLCGAALARHEGRMFPADRATLAAATKQLRRALTSEEYDSLTRSGAAFDERGMISEALRAVQIAQSRVTRR